MYNYVIRYYHFWHYKVKFLHQLFSPTMLFSPSSLNFSKHLIKNEKILKFDILNFVI